MTRTTFRMALLISAVLIPFTAAANDDASLEDLDTLSLESLGNIVTSVSKKPEDSFNSAAAIYVITNEDIKLSGATHIAEVLRGVPGLSVAQIDSSNWAISSRGFNGSEYANKLLVLVDGRSVYTPLFSGVYWDIQNLVLEDIDRIEVIRGPGASLWGANAVNGVINIITKNAAETQGTYASTIVGTQDRLIGEARQGVKLGDDAYMRVYAKYENRDQTKTIDGANGNNKWDNSKTGFRSDWKASDTRKITLQGDAYDADINLNLSIPSFFSTTGSEFRQDKIDTQGFNVIGRWEEKHTEELNSTFQTYIDYKGHDYTSLQQDIYTYDFDHQTAWQTSERNDIVFGSGLRYINSNLTGNPPELNVVRDIDSETILNAFIQDQYALIPKELYLTLGSKFEHNSFSGFEVEPNARIAWSPDNKQTLWAAISQAVRTPSIAERSISGHTAAIAPGIIAQQQFNRNFASEDLTAYELGYRIKPTSQVTIDSTAFLNDYKNLRTFEPLTPEITPDGVYLPFQLNNLGKGKAYGFETAINWDATSRWSLNANYSYINLVLEQGSSLDPTFKDQEGQTPHHQLMMNSQLFLPYDFQLINTGYYVSALKTSDVDAYFRFDTQIIWQAGNGIELALVGQNLLDSAHQEFGAPLTGFANEIPRSVYGRITFRY
jgi:iron complex outermembrane recepter protein